MIHFVFNAVRPDNENVGETRGAVKLINNVFKADDEIISEVDCLSGTTPDMGDQCPVSVEIRM